MECLYHFHTKKLYKWGMGGRSLFARFKPEREIMPILGLKVYQKLTMPDILCYRW